LGSGFPDSAVALDTLRRPGIQSKLLGFLYWIRVLRDYPIAFAAIVSWQLGSLPKESLSTMSLITWGLAICFIVVMFLSYQYFFMVPVVFSGAIAVCFILGAWLAGRP
jgi:hypothetical protein